MRSGGRRGVAALLVAGVLGLSGCGDQESSDFAVERIDGLNDEPTASSMADWYTDDSDIDVSPTEPSPAQEPTPTETPTYEPPERPALDRTELDANLAALSPADRDLVDHYLHAKGEDRLGEGTWVVAAPMTVDEAVQILFGPDPQDTDDLTEEQLLSGEFSGYSVIQVGDGIVAYEDTGFADPPKRLLAALSEGGGASAVATDNIEAMTRFGYARDGKVVYDNYEYAFADSLDEIPAEVRDLARLAWEDPEGPMVATASWSKVAMAMSEKVTGVRATRAVQDGQDWYVVPVAWGAMEDY